MEAFFSRFSCIHGGGKENEGGKGLGVRVGTVLGISVGYELFDSTLQFNGLLDF